MKAVVYRGPHDIRLEEVPEPVIQAAEDALVQVTTTSICGSDLHVLHGLVPNMKTGDIIGHEFTGVVREVGPAVDRFKPGDRVVGPAAVWCGRCRACVAGLPSACERGGVFGHGPLFGGLDGAQAEYVRVPFADVTLQPIPAALADDQVLFAGDVLPTAYSAVAGLNPAVRGVQRGDTVVVFGAGPVGLCAVASARLFDPKRVIAVDVEPRRLALAGELGADTCVDASREDVRVVVEGITAGRGADYAVEAVGSQETLAGTVAVTAPGGVISVVGVFQRPAASNGPKMLAKNLVLCMGMGDLGHMAYMIGLIEAGRLDLRPMITHRMGLDEAPRAYGLFEQRADGAVKILLTP